MPEGASHEVEKAMGLSSSLYRHDDLEQMGDLSGSSSRNMIGHSSFRFEFGCSGRDLIAVLGKVKVLGFSNAVLDAMYEYSHRPVRPSLCA